MATYAQRPDGLYEVTLDDGRVMPTALDPSVLEAQGFMPQNQPPAPMPDERTAGLNFNPVSVTMQNQAPPVTARDFTPMVVTPGMAPSQATPMQQQGPPESLATTEQWPPKLPEQGPGRVDPSRLAPAGGTPTAPATPGVAPTQGGNDAAVFDATQKYMAGLLAPRRGAPGRLVPAHDERAAYSIKYKDSGIDPQLEEDISESRIDQQLASQDTSEQEEYARASQARLAAKEARQAQRDVEETVRRKNAIEKQVGERLQAIDARLAKARAVTESGSARERVMRDKGSFGRILAVIGQALATFAMPQTGGKNIVTEQINREVDEELEREKQLYDVSPETSALKAYVDAWGTPQQALKEMELTKRQAVQAQMEAWIRRADAERVPIEFRQWLADNALAIQEQKRKLQEDAAAEVVEQWRHVPDRVVGGGGPKPLDPLEVAQKGAQFSEAMRKIYNDPKQADAAMQRIRETQAGRTVRTPGGEQLFAPDQKRAQEAEMQLAAISHIQNNIDEISRLLSKPYSEVNLADRERINVLVQSSVTLGKEAEKLGALSGPDMALIEPLAGALARQRLNPLNPDVKIRAGLSQASQHFRSRGAAAERGLYRDPHLTQPYRASAPGSFAPIMGGPVRESPRQEAEE